MDNKILIEYAEGEIEVYRKIASSDNPDVDPTIVTESKADAKAGLPCDASSYRVTANYYGKFVNDYYRGYKLGEATNG